MIPSTVGTSYYIIPEVNPGKYEPLLPTTEEHTAAEFTVDKELVNEDPRRLIPVYTYGYIS